MHSVGESYRPLTLSKYVLYKILTANSNTSLQHWVVSIGAWLEARNATGAHETKGSAYSSMDRYMLLYMFPRHFSHRKVVGIN